MSTIPSPEYQRCASAAEAEAYDHWYRAKVQAAIADPAPGLPHAAVMAEMLAIIEAKIEAQRKVSHASGDLERRG